jgi:divalent metal cation (Fe/Co/Zn/Cd) transporter
MKNIRHRIGRMVYIQARLQIENRLSDQVYDQIKDQVWRQIDGQIWKEIDLSVHQIVWNRICNRIVEVKL